MSVVNRFTYLSGVSLLLAAAVWADDSLVEYDAAGNVVVTASGERIVYSREELANGSIALEAAAAHVTLSSSSIYDDETYLLDMPQVWRHSVWGSNLGQTGIKAVDLDGDGTTELVLGATLSRNFGQNKNWHVVRYNPSSGEYDIVFTSNDNPYWGDDRVDINAINVFQINGKQRIFVGYSNGSLVEFDGATLTAVRSVEIGVREILSIEYADGDNDGIKEIVVSSEDKTTFLTPVSLAVESEIPVGGREMRIGNVDNDPQLEIVYVAGQVLEYDGTTYAEQWNFSGLSLGRWLQLGDLDGDGVDELVVSRSWDYIDILDARLQSPIGQIATDINISQLKLADVNADGNPDVLYGDQQHGYVHAINGLTLQELWRLKNPSSGAPGIEVADVDDDGELEVIWGAGSNSTAPDFLSIHDIATLAREFVNIDEGGPYRAIALGNVDDDPDEELVVIAYEGDRYSGTSWVDNTPMHVFRVDDFSEKWSAFNLSLSGGYYKYNDVAIGDIDGGGRNEVVTGGYWREGIRVFDALTKTLKRSGNMNGEEVYSIALADFTGDGYEDIAALAGRQLHIVNGRNFVTEWSSIVFAYTGTVGYTGVETAEITGDAVPDIIASLGTIFIIDGSTKVYRQTPDMDYGGFAVGEDAAGEKIIWAGTAAGELARINLQTLQREIVGKVCDDRVSTVKVSTAAALAGSVQFACDDTVGLWGIFEERVVWRSPVLGNQVGLWNSLIATGSGDQALLIVGTDFGVHAFKGFGIGNKDVDDDGVLNHVDNCPRIANTDQADADGDGTGDVCNDIFDSDGDEWADALDNCAMTVNPDQADADGNGVGDACNDTDDIDGDEWETMFDNCLATANPDQADRDGDMVGDVCDPYPDNADNYAARCEEAIVNEANLGVELNTCLAIPKFVDDDGDGEANSTDACPDTPPLAAVDAAGCDQAQFCSQYSGTGWQSAKACNKSDWRNDEPVKSSPMDCRASVPRSSGRVQGVWRDQRFTCVAR